MRNEHKIWLETLKGRDHSEDLGVHGRIILKFILENLINWIHLTQDRELFS
jgi:hypothetical protein